METNELCTYYNMIDKSIPESQIIGLIDKQRERINNLWRQYDFDEWHNGNNIQSLYSAVKGVFEQPRIVIQSKQMLTDKIDIDKNIKHEIEYRKDKFQEWEHDFQIFINANLKEGNQAIKQILLFIDQLIDELKENINIHKIDYLRTPLTQYFIERLIYYKSRIDSILGETKLLNIENLIQHYNAQKKDKHDKKIKIDELKTSDTEKQNYITVINKINLVTFPEIESEKKEIETTPPDYSELLKELSDYIDGINELEFNNIIIHHSLSPGTPKAKWKTKRVDAHNFATIIGMTIPQFNNCFSFYDGKKLQHNYKDRNDLKDQPIVKILRQYFDK